MILWIATPPQAVSLTILGKNTRKPSSPRTQSRVTMKKTETALLTARNTIETTVAEMDLSSIN